LTVGRRLAFLGALLAVGCTGRRDAPPVAEEQPLPGGYQAVVDTVRGDPGKFELTLEGDVVHIMTGPAGIAWRPEDAVGQGDFLAEATFTVSGAPPGYSEGYGIFVGGRDLDGPAPRSTYLLVRPTGELFIGQVAGDTTVAVAAWTTSDAVQAVRAHGDEPANVLGILREGDEVRFLVNGTVVHTAPASAVDARGIAGVRIDHRLDIRVGSWYLGAPPLETPMTSP